METPNLVLGSYIISIAFRRGVGSTLGWLVVSLFMLHYFIRTIVYSQLMKGAKPMPLDVFLVGVLFTTVNGLVQTYHHLFEGTIKDEPLSNNPRIVLGLTLFCFGFLMNQWSDDILRRLRKDESDTKYYIPQGIPFKYLSAPNLVGGEFVFV